MHWLSYGGGVNSTALAVLLVNGHLPQYEPFRVTFSDTKTEKPETYAYIRDHFGPWFEARGHKLETVYPKEGVLERWERLKVTGSRILRTCTDLGKIRPLETHYKENGGGIQLIGIDAGEPHRAVPRPGKVYPLVDLDIDREGCVDIIKSAGLPVPAKSGCWCCPFMRVGEVIRLAKEDACKFDRIERLELAAFERNGNYLWQWGDRPASYWRERAKQGDLFIQDRDPEIPCGCYD